MKVAAGTKEESQVGKSSWILVKVMHMCSNAYLSGEMCDQRGRKRGGLIGKHRHTGREEPDLGTLSLNPVEDCFVGRVTEATFHPLFLVVLIAFAQSLGTVIEGVPEWFVDASQHVRASHEDLEHAIYSVSIE